MANRQEATGSAWGPIIELEDSERIIVKVLTIRDTEGEYKGHLVDCETMSGSLFSINGHTILVDKLNQLMMGGNDWFEIHRDGMVGRAINYSVYLIRATDSELSNDAEEQQALMHTEEYIDKQIKSIPPRN